VGFGSAMPGRSEATGAGATAGGSMAKVGSEAVPNIKHCRLLSL